MLILAFLLQAVTLAETRTANGDITPAFWLSADLIAIDWRHSCLNNGGCSDPRFKLQTSNLITGEKLAIDWAIAGDLKEKVRSFVSYWISGLPDDIAINAEIVGIDPTYGFPRICDQSAMLRIFERDTDAEELVRRHKRATELLNVVSSSERTLLEIRGRCFNASLSIAKYDKSCPWCKAESTEATILHGQDEAMSANSSGFFNQFKHSDHLLQIGMITLALIAVVTSAAFASLLVIVCHRRRNIRGGEMVWKGAICGGTNGDGNNQHHHPRVEHEYHERLPPPPRAVQTYRARNGSDDTMTKYETPWDQKFRPLPYWLKSEILCPGGRKSPDDGISLHGATSERTATTTIDNRSPHVSPNSSIGRQDDSGLEVV